MVKNDTSKEIDNLYDMVKNEKPDEIAVLTNWLRVILRDDTTRIYHEVKQAEEIRTMFATKLEQYGEKLRKEALREGKLQGKQEGKQEGKLEGKLEGIHEKAVQTAKALLKKGMPLKDISEITGLSIKEIKKF